MKAKGPRVERETIIIWNEDDDYAEVYTASDIEYRRMKKAGYKPEETRDGRGVFFRFPKDEIRLPRRKRKLTDAELEQRRKARQNRGNDGGGVEG